MTDAARLIYDELLRSGHSRVCDLARKVGLKPSTVSSFLRRMQLVGTTKHTGMRWDLSDDFRARYKPWTPCNE